MAAAGLGWLRRCAIAVVVAAGFGGSSGPATAQATRVEAGPAAGVPLPTPFIAPEAAGAPLKRPSPSGTAAPDQWTKSEIEDAQRVCRDALKAINAVVEPMAPIKEGRCGAPGPVRLIQIGRRHPVTFEPPPTINCAMLAPLKRWIDTSLQPLAAKHLDSRVTRVSIMASYTCRTRYGRKEARMSEHAFANALDIGGFGLASKSTVTVLDSWGPTQRDKVQEVARVEALRVEAERVEALRAEQRPRATLAGRPGGARLPLPAQRDQTDASAGGLPRAAADRPGPSVARPDLPPLPVRRPLRQAIRAGAPGRAGTPGRVNKPPAAPATAPVTYKTPQRLGGPKADAPSSPAARFLHGAHQGACILFGTVLGPEANEPHRNHFHLDMHPRRRRNYCQ